MTNEENIKQANTQELAKLLFDFFIGFHNESIDGLCVNACSDCDHDCINGINKWLKMTFKSE